MNDNTQAAPFDELLVFLPQLEKLGPDDVYVDHCGPITNPYLIKTVNPSSSWTTSTTR